MRAAAVDAVKVKGNRRRCLHRHYHMSTQKMRSTTGKTDVPFPRIFTM